MDMMRLQQHMPSQTTCASHGVLTAAAVRQKAGFALIVKRVQSPERMLRDPRPYVISVLEMQCPNPNPTLQGNPRTLRLVSERVQIRSFVTPDLTKADRVMSV